MISYLFSVINKQIYWDKVYQLLKENNDNFEIIFVLHESNEELNDIKLLSENNSNVHYYVYENGTSENQMISNAIKYVNGTELVLCRDFFEYTPVMSDFLIEMGKSGAQICLFQKNIKKNKLKKFLKAIYKKITKTIFGFESYEGNVGLVYFGNIALSVLKEVKDITLLTKVNRWKGFDISYALTDVINCSKPERKSLKNTVFNLISASLIMFLLIIALSMLIAFNVIGYVLILLFTLFILIDIFWLFYLILKLYIVIKLGDLK